MAETIFDAVAGSTNENLKNLIQRVSTSSSVAHSGGTATIPYPTGLNISNTIIVNQYLLSGGILYTYPSATVETLQSDGIHVKNAGGASGTIYVDVAKWGG